MEIGQIAHAWYWFLFMVLAFVLGQLGVHWRMKRAAIFILKDLHNKGATSPQKAVPVPYHKSNLLRLGIRDLRPKVLESLIYQGFVGITADQKFYLVIENLPKQLWETLTERR